MKKTILALMMSLAACLASHQAKAQNVQLFYDTGRGCVTSTVEMFRPDSFGST